jgi:hypothetical protein
MNPKPFPLDALRTAIAGSIPAQASQFGDEPPEPRFLYLPRAHVRALHADTMLVQGIRGAGKSVWWAALQQQAHRLVLASVLGHTVIDLAMRVSPGFGPRQLPLYYPGKDSLAPLIAAHQPRHIWRTIVLRLLLDQEAQATLGATWEERVRWVESHPDKVDEKLFRVDEDLRARGQRHLIVFDALDTAADTWADRRRMLKGLLEILLDLRGYRAVRAKAFVRPDMLLAPDVTSFPDASKLLANDVRLSWPRADLFALLWQHLANAENGGDAFRQACATQFGQGFQRVGDVWIMSEDLRRDEDLQRDVFHAITGPYMGEGPKRGFPYTWLPNRLADTQGQVSPRSFLAALRAAGEDDSNRGGDYPIHYEAIKTGVQAASRIRVEELGDDHPWVRAVMKPLRGLIVPCDEDEIEQRWHDDDTLAALSKELEQARPSRLPEGHRGLRKELEDLAIFEVMGDGRVNMADVYRVGFGLGRRGGVRPVR